MRPHHVREHEWSEKAEDSEIWNGIKSEDIIEGFREALSEPEDPSIPERQPNQTDDNTEPLLDKNK